jgi:prepilin-type N-terminal cleavage/methylation domain-containing protein
MPDGFRSPRPRAPRRDSPRKLRGFTLTELLIVIAIIAVLASLITAASLAALRRAKQARISLALNELSTALENFKNDYGAYPPNAAYAATNETGVGPADLAYEDFRRALKKAFPRHREPDELAAALTAYGGAAGRDGPGLVGGGLNGMNAAEALYFWLGGFSKDPQYPISGPGGPSFLANQLEQLEGRDGNDVIDVGLLGPRSDNGTFAGRYVVYEVNVNGAVQRRRINLWQYVPSGSRQPVVYFDASRHAPQQQWLPAGSGAGAQIYPVTRLPEGVAEANVTNLAQAVIFANKGKFQILHAGIDDAWGNMALLAPGGGLVYPSGPFIGELSDNLANFTTGTLAEASEQ